MTLVFRDAVPGDEALLLRFVRALAEYEKLEHEVVATEADLATALFSPAPYCHALLAEQDGAAIGFAIWFTCFSTFTGRPTFYVEDVFVQPAERGRGVGRAIFRELARRAMAERCARMEWAVLNDNEPAVNFYRGIGAQPMREWTVQRLSGDRLARLAG